MVLICFYEFSRKIFKKQKLSNCLVTSYFEKNNLDSFVKKKRFLKLLQFLFFIRNLEALKQFINDQVYYLIEFPVADFLRFTGVNEKSQYQRTKVLKFLTF